MQRRFTGAWTIQRLRHFERYKRCSAHRYRHSRYILHPRAVYPFYRFSRVSERLQRAFTATVLSVAATVVGLLAMTLVPSDTPPYTPSTFYLLFSLIALAGVIAAYVSQFWLYTGLDDVCTERGYDFPPKRIRWCFYLSLINILLRMLPTSIPIFLSQIASLVLLALFIRAAYQAEKLTV